MVFPCELNMRGRQTECPPIIANHSFYSVQLGDFSLFINSFVIDKTKRFRCVSSLYRVNEIRWSINCRASILLRIMIGLFFVVFIEEVQRTDRLQKSTRSEETKNGKVTFCGNTIIRNEISIFQLNSHGHFCNEKLQLQSVCVLIPWNYWKDCYRKSTANFCGNISCAKGLPCHSCGSICYCYPGKQRNQSIGRKSYSSEFGQKGFPSIVTISAINFDAFEGKKKCSVQKSHSLAKLKKLQWQTRTMPHHNNRIT